MEIVLVLVLLLTLALGYVLLRAGRSMRAESGVPLDVQVVYSDTGAWEHVEKPFFSQRYRLTGKPDYIVQDADGVYPIEVKPNRPDTQPRAADVMQLMAYGVLMEEADYELPAYGLLKYRDQVFRIEFSDDLRAEFFDTLDEMRRDRLAADVHRSHDLPVRCKYCGYRDDCDERLDPASYQA